MVRYLLLLCALVSGSGVSAGPVSLTSVDQAFLSHLESLLNVDRFQYYLSRMAEQLKGPNAEAAAKILKNAQTSELQRLTKFQERSVQTSEWDKLAFEYIKIKLPGLNIQPNEIGWGYNFMKNKILAAFIIRELKVSAAPAKIHQAAGQAIAIPPSAAKEQILLDTDMYIAEKTTRAVFWDAHLNNLTTELFVGTELEFRQQIKNEGRVIIAQVNPMARNYNKIYVLKDLASGTLTYGISNISGQDRVTHFLQQISLLRAQLIGSKDKAPIVIHGTAKNIHETVERQLTQVFDSLPKPDQVIVGQLASIDTFIETAKLIQLIKKHGNPINKFHAKILAEKSLFAFGDEPSDVKKLALELGIPTVGSQAVVSFETPSHDVADYIFNDQSGSGKRLRVISAVWGDEIIPIARALKKLELPEVTYIGTAGAFRNKGIKIGDVVEARRVIHQNQSYDLVSGGFSFPSLLTNKTVVNVPTPFVETTEWLQKNEKIADVVEIETAYLRFELGEKTKLNTFFLISDIVGSETETLAHAVGSASKRKRGQFNLFSSVFSKFNFTEPVTPVIKYQRLGKIFQRLQEKYPSRNPLFLIQVAINLDRTLIESPTDQQLVDYATLEKNFDEKILTDRIGQLKATLATAAKISGGSLSMALLGNINAGLFNPMGKNSIVVRIANTDDLSFARAQQYLNTAGSSVKIDFTIEKSSENSSQAEIKIFPDSPTNEILEYFNTIYSKLGFPIEVNINGYPRLEMMHHQVLAPKCIGVL